MEMLGVSINVCRSVIVFFFNDTATTEIYTLSLHDALPICPFSLCIPYASIEPVLERLSRAKDDQARALARRQAAELTQQRLSDVEVDVSVRFRPLRLPSSRIASLAVGDVVPLGHRTTTPLAVTSAATTFASAVPG